ncbi:MAG: hypothetical protein ACOCWM_01665 [Cyclobacteriaceae bacterium]
MLKNEENKSTNPGDKKIDGKPDNINVGSTKSDGNKKDKSSIIKIISKLFNRYVLALIILIFVCYIQLNFYIEIIVLVCITFYLFIRLFFKIFKKPEILSIIDTLYDIVLKPSLNYFKDDDEKKRIAMMNFNTSINILKNKYFPVLNLSFFFIHLLASFCILILSSAVILQNLYLLDNNNFKVVEHYVINFYDFILLSLNSILLIDYSIIQPFSFEANLIITFNSIIFITVSILWLLMFSIITTYKPLELKFEKGESENDLNFEFYKLNSILQSQGLFKAIQFFKDKFINKKRNNSK